MEQIKVGDIIRARTGTFYKGVPAVLQVVELGISTIYDNSTMIKCKELFTRSLRPSRKKKSVYVWPSEVIEVLSEDKVRVLEEFSKVFYGK